MEKHRTSGEKAAMRRIPTLSSEVLPGTNSGHVRVGSREVALESFQTLGGFPPRETT